MSTRARYSFYDSDDIHHVYKHHDGYPSGACKAIGAALISAWSLPRFEADEFAAAFIAANKRYPGDIRLTHGPDSHGDLAYRYEIRCRSGQLEITAFDPEQQIWRGNLTAMAKWAREDVSQ